MSKWHNKSFFYHYGINYYDKVFSVDDPKYTEIETFCNKPVYYFDMRADDSIHKPMNKDRKIFKYDVLFIGSYEKDRYNSLKYLARHGIKVDIFGNMWNKCPDYEYKNLTIHFKELIGESYALAISNSKITLGFLRKINNDSQNSRAFEIPACGGFMLMERTNTLLRLFQEGSEAEFFDTDMELLKKINFYLNESLLREVVASNGRDRVVSSGYFFSNLANEMISKAMRIEQ